MEGNNMAAMREALEFLRDQELFLLECNVRHCIGLTVFCLEQTCKIMRGVIEEALSAPPRNCDVGTAEEQDARFVKWRYSNPLRAELGLDALAWAQMPYEAEAKKDERNDAFAQTQGES